jgi:hypothetical protein
VRANALLLYAIVFLTGLAGMTQFSWWAVGVGGCLLSLKLISDHRVTADGTALTWEIAYIGSSLFISIIASVLAFAGGRLTAALWGL